MSNLDPYTLQARPERIEKSADMGARISALRFALSGGAPGFWAFDHLKELQHMTGWNFPAVHAFALQLAGAKRQAFYQPPVKSRRSRMPDDPVKALEWLEERRAKRKQKSFTPSDEGDNTKKRPLPASHPLSKLLARPNPDQSGAVFYYQMGQQLGLTGGCVVWTLRDNITTYDKRGTPRERYIIPTGLAIAQPASAAFPFGSYRVQPIGSYALFRGADTDDWFSGAVGTLLMMGGVIDARNIRLIGWPHPLYVNDFASAVTAGSVQIDIAEAIDNAIWARMKNQANPGMVYQWESQEAYSRVSDEDMAAFRADVRSRNSGTANTGKDMIVPPGLKADHIDYSPKDMDYANSRPQARDGVFAMHQTPGVVAGITDAGSYSQYFASLRQFTDQKVQPNVELIAEEETEDLCPAFGPGYTIEGKAKTIEDPTLEQQTKQRKLLSGAYTVDEYRASEGDPPHPDPEIGKSPAGKPPQPPGGGPGGPGGAGPGDGGLPGGGDPTGGIQIPALGTATDTGTPNPTKKAVTGRADVLGKSANLDATPKPTEPEHKYASTQIEFAEPLRSRILSVAAAIPASDLGEEGREDTPHVTVRYGLITDDPQSVIDVVRGHGPITVKLGKTSLFTNPEADVLKLDVTSDSLYRLNEALKAAIPHTDKYPLYVPHVTLAYLKPGAGGKYIGWAGLDGETTTINELIFSDRNRNRVVIPLAKAAALDMLGKSFDEGKHPRADDGKFGSGSGSHHADAGRKAVAILAAGVKAPLHLIQGMKATGRALMRRVESRYGPKVTKAVGLAVMASLPIPLPGMSIAVAAPILAFAELHRQLFGKSLETAADTGTNAAQVSSLALSVLEHLFGDDLPEEVDLSKLDNAVESSDMITKNLDPYASRVSRGSLPIDSEDARKKSLAWLQAHGGNELAIQNAAYAFLTAYTAEFQAALQQLAAEGQPVTPESAAALINVPQLAERYKAAILPAMTTAAVDGAKLELQAFAPGDAGIEAVKQKAAEESKTLYGKDFWTSLAEHLRDRLVAAVVVATAASPAITVAFFKQVADTAAKGNKVSANSIGTTAATNSLGSGQGVARNVLVSMGVNLRKQWVCMMDGRERPTHHIAHGQTVPYNGKFVVGGHQCDFPGDPSLPIEETAGCRCHAVTIPDPSQPTVKTKALEWLGKDSKFDESKHPRDENGHFVSAGAIADAAGDPAKREKLESSLSPENREKLNAAIHDHNGKRGAGDGKPNEHTDGDKSGESKPAATREQKIASPAFKSWFGDWANDPANASKVVNDKGEPQETHDLPGTRPMMMYHGTPNAQFDEFRKDKQWNPERQLYGPGFYFTDSKDVAETYRDKGATYQLAGDDKGTIAQEYERRLVKAIGLRPGEWSQDQLLNDLLDPKASHEEQGIKVDDLRKPTDGGGVFTVYLNIRKPFDIENHKVPAADLPEDVLATVRSKVAADIRKNPANDSLMEDWGRIQAGLASGKDPEKWQKRRDKYAPKVAALQEEIKRAETGSPGDAFDYKTLHRALGTKTKVNALLQQLGHDGITHIGGKVLGDDGFRHKVWIAFEPHQIKSVDNEGTFDPTSNNMNKWLNLNSFSLDDLMFTKGFTGTVNAKNGITYHYVDGHRVPAHEFEQKKADPSALEQKTKPTKEQSKVAIDKAVSAPHELTHDDIAALPDHFANMNMHELRAYKKQLAASGSSAYKEPMIEAIHAKIAAGAGVVITPDKLGAGDVQAPSKPAASPAAASSSQSNDATATEPLGSAVASQPPAVTSPATEAPAQAAELVKPVDEPKPSADKKKTSGKAAGPITGDPTAEKPTGFSVEAMPEAAYAATPEGIPGWQAMASLPPSKQAYGAVVLRTDPATGKTQVLLREPAGHFDGYAWTWPKGKRDDNAISPADVAHKELGEETGYSGKIVGHLPQLFGSSGVTKNAFFVMAHDGKEHDPSKMDAETASTKWVDLDKAHELIGQTTKIAGRQRDLDILEAARKFAKRPTDPKIDQTADKVSAIVGELHGAGDYSPKSLHASLHEVLQPLHPETIAAVCAKHGVPDVKALKDKLSDELEAAAKFPGFPGSPAVVTEIKGLGGSTGAKLVAYKGNSFVMKSGNNPGHIREEHAADSIYDAMGVPVPKAQLHETPNGPVKIAQHLGDAVTLQQYLKTASPYQKEAVNKQLQQHFVMDALLGNWDVIGMNADNVMVDNAGNAWRIDNGGSLRYRAQGEPKPSHQWSGSVDEINTMRDPKTNPQAAAVFGSISKKEIADQVQQIVANKQKILDAAPADVRDTLRKRIDHLAEFHGSEHGVAQVTGSIYLGHGTDWATVKPAASVTLKVAPKDENHPTFKPLADSEPRKAVSSGSYAPSFTEHMSAALKAATPSETKATKNYTGSAYNGINSKMRNCPETLDCLDGATRKAAGHIESAIAKAGTFETPVNVWRNTGIQSGGPEGKKFLAAMAQAALTGEAVRMPGFKSTSMSPTTHMGGGDIKLEIRAKSGLWVQPISLHASEKELLQGHNTRYRVVSVKDAKDYPGSDWGIDAKKIIQLEEI